MYALSFLSPGEAGAQTREDFLNVYTPPTNPTKLHLGSGDGNGDGWVDWNDYNMMVAGEENNMMMDLDLDSLQNTEMDREILAKYLRGDINSLPHQDMRLKTRVEKDDRLEKILRIDQTSKIPPSPTWVSGDYGILTSLNGMGYWDPNDLNIPEKYKEFSHLFGKLHTKIYFVGIEFPVGPGHGAAAKFQIGNSLGSANDTPTNFSAWNFFEPRNDGINIQPGDWNMPYGSKVYVFGIEGFNEIGGASLFSVVYFEIDSVGKDSLTYQAPGLVTERPFDETNPEISITSPVQNSTHKSHVSSLEYILTEENPRVCLYSLDGATKIQTPCGETITGLQSKQGNNKWYLFAEDLFGNTSRDSVEFRVDTTNVDTTKPVIYIISPVDSTYEEHFRGMEYLLSDANPGDSMQYSTDGGLTRISILWGNPIPDAQSEDGLNKWLIYAKDAFGNIGKDSVEFRVDTTTIGIGDGPKAIPLDFALKQNYPNPFNSNTMIKYTLPKRDHVYLDIYDIGGRKLETLVNGNQEAGEYKVPFDASKYSSGVYLYRLRTKNGISKTKKMMLLK